MNPSETSFALDEVGVVRVSCPSRAKVTRGIEFVEGENSIIGELWEYGYACEWGPSVFVSLGFPKCACDGAPLYHVGRGSTRSAIVASVC